jgi:hypothetical protein
MSTPLAGQDTTEPSPGRKGFVGPRLSPWLSMIFSENRFTPFRIML